MQIEKEEIETDGQRKRQLDRQTEKEKGDSKQKFCEIDPR